jgi:spore coat-associated protein S
MDYTVVDGTCYVLSGAVEGKNPSYASKNELALIIRGLAEFHTASHGFEVLPDTKPKIHLGNWVQDLTSQLEEMKTFYEQEAP